MLYVHQTVNKYGRLERVSTTHHVRDRDRRGRWTLFPASLIGMVESVPADIEGRLYPSPRGHYWAHRNFYRNVWEPARLASGTDFTLYDARHTFSSRLLAAGIPLIEVSAWMGHSLRAGGEQVKPDAQVRARHRGVHQSCPAGTRGFHRIGGNGCQREAGGVMSGPIGTIDGRGRSDGYDALSEPMHSMHSKIETVTWR